MASAIAHKGQPEAQKQSRSTHIAIILAEKEEAIAHQNPWLQVLAESHPHQRQ